MTGQKRARLIVVTPALAAALAWAAASFVSDPAAGQSQTQPTPQTPQQQQPAAGAAPSPPPARGLFPAQPPPAFKPGFIYAFGHWWDSARGTLDNLRRQSHSAAQSAASATKDAIDHAAQATRSAATAIGQLPTARFIEMHQRCAIAPNGAPDCRTAAAYACRGKGYADGRPIDVQSAENCPPAVWMSGRVPAPGECPTETVILMAACN